MRIINRSRTRWAAVAAAAVALTLGSYAAVADGVDNGATVQGDQPIPVDSNGGIGDTPMPVEPDGGIGDTPMPVDPDGGIGDTPMPVEPDGGIGDTPMPLDRAG